jgi:hypothetical protein
MEVGGGANENDKPSHNAANLFQSWAAQLNPKSAYQAPSVQAGS